MAGLPVAAAAVEPPVIPLGLDAYRQWDRWAYQRIGVRAYLRSTYDRHGGNDSADASGFLYQLADDHNVTLDVAGPGMLYFVRTNHWHGSPWRYTVDGREILVAETSTEKKSYETPNAVFLPEKALPPPLAVTWATTKGADLNWVPVGFSESFRMGYTWTCYGTGYYIYHQWVPGTRLSQPLQAWDGQSAPAADVLELLNRAGSDLLPAADSAAAKTLALAETQGRLDLAAQDQRTILHAQGAPAMMRALHFSVPRAQAVAFGRTRIRITWDDRAHASIDAPVALFFGAGTLYNRDDREYLVKALPMTIRYDAARVHLACYFPMPYFKSARIELLGNGETPLTDIAWSVRQVPLKDSPSQLGYFHATYRDHGRGVAGQDNVFLDTRGLEGSSDWSGSFVGTSFIFSDRSVLGTLEGDPRFFFDDSETPQGQGTGTEEWGGGGDYWGGVNMTLPLAGHPVGAPNARSAKNAEDNIQSAYRFLLADLMPFGKNARIQLEHGGENLSDEHYRSVTYWYGAPTASLKKTDSLQIGDAASERAHDYVSPQASEPYSLTSRYELGVDRIPGAPPLDATPSDYAEFEFEAEAGKLYFIWVRGRSDEPKVEQDQFWLQFDDDIGTRFSDRGANSLLGYGFWARPWFPAADYSWSSGHFNRAPRTITFERSGRHRVRLQPRFSGHRLEEIWLTPDHPSPPERNAVAQGGVLIRATEPNVIQGQFRVIDDPGARSGKALHIVGSGTAPAADVEVLTAHTDNARKTVGTSEFTLRIDPHNVGVLLRRKLDYAFPNQRAEVFIADASRNEPIEATAWKAAGTWYLAGSNTWVHSRPREEFGPTVHLVRTSNRRFRDDEFLVARNLTEGRSAIRVRVQFVPVDRPLFPGHPPSEKVWSEIRYDAYSFVLPDWKP